MVGNVLIANNFKYQNSHLDIQFNAFLLVAMDLPYTVQPFGVALWPIRRQDGAGRLRQLPSAQSCRGEERTMKVPMK